MADLSNCMAGLERHLPSLPESNDMTHAFEPLRRCSWTECVCSVHKPAHKLRVCKGCCVVAYCGTKCQTRCVSFSRCVHVDDGANLLFPATGIKVATGRNVCAAPSRYPDVPRQYCLHALCEPLYINILYPKYQEIKERSTLHFLQLHRVSSLSVGPPLRNRHAPFLPRVLLL